MEYDTLNANINRQSSARVAQFIRKFKKVILNFAYRSTTILPTLLSGLFRFVWVRQKKNSACVTGVVLSIYSSDLV